MMQIAPWVVGACMVFALGVLCGARAAWERYARALAVRDAAAREETEKLAGYMISGVQFNAAILTLLQAPERKPPTIIVDWDMLRQAANGAGYTLVKEAAREVGAAMN